MRAFAIVALSLVCFGSGFLTADSSPSKKGPHLVDNRDTSGLWALDDANGPCAAVYRDRKLDAAIIGVGSGRPGEGLDFAVVANKERAFFQVRDSKGKIHHIPVEALLKLAGDDARPRP